MTPLERLEQLEPYARENLSDSVGDTIREAIESIKQCSPGSACPHLKALHEEHLKCYSWITAAADTALERNREKVRADKAEEIILKTESDRCAELVRKLVKYGAHITGCKWYRNTGFCDCGLGIQPGHEFPNKQAEP